jgi:ERCC4-type nuclease
MPKQPPFVILVDSREQLPLTFGLTPTRTMALPTGDYGIMPLRELEEITPSFIFPIAIERKSIADLLGCIGQSRQRFEREIQRLAKFRYAAIVVEGSLQDVIRGTPHSQILPQQVMGSLCAWDRRYGVRFHFAGDRLAAAALVRKLLIGFATDYFDPPLVVRFDSDNH